MINKLLSVILFLLLSPLFFLIIICVYLDIGVPIFFQQERAGLNGSKFIIFKFRTMINRYDEYGNILPDEKRLSFTGKVLRKTSLDEIPSLINVIKGDMNIVGPRPLLLEYNSLYTDFEKIRLNVKPGITGWAQVNGRNTITWKEKFNLDVWYVKNRTIFLDLKIIIFTIYQVIRVKGVYTKENKVMPKFKGTNNEKR